MLSRLNQIVYQYPVAYRPVTNAESHYHQAKIPPQMKYTITFNPLFHSSCPDDRNRALVRMSALENVHDQRNEERTQEQHDSPVEVLQRNRDRIWPERPEEDECDVDDADAVDWYTPAAETPACFWDQFRVSHTAVENAAYGDAVGKHDGYHLHGDDGVECGVGADVDQREEAGDCAGEDDRVYRELF